MSDPMGRPTRGNHADRAVNLQDSHFHLPDVGYPMLPQRCLQELQIQPLLSEVPFQHPAMKHQQGGHSLQQRTQRLPSEA